MALGDITILNPAQFGSIGAKRYAVALAATAILAGEPVVKALGGSSVTVMQTSKPLVGTDFLAGIAASSSTQTASAAGTVDVWQIVPNVVYLIKPNSAAAWDTQAEYDALVGDRVLIDLTTGSYTILATDNASNGCVIEPLDIAKYPGRVAFSFRTGVSYLA